MKKIFFSILLAAITLSSCTPQSNSAAPVIAANGQAMSIAYIDMDSLMVGYTLYDDLQKTYEQEVRRIENEINKIGAALEKDIADYQEKVQKMLITRSQASQKEEELTMRQQNFLQQRESAMAEISQNEMIIVGQIQYAVRNYLQEYNKDQRYAMIMSNTGGMPIMNANPALNITDDVRKGLNAHYKANK